jgi:hypothetical protein
MSLYGLGMIAAVLAAAAGTGSAAEARRLSKQEYEQRVQTLYAGVQSAFQATRGSSGRELAERIALAQKALRAAADGLMLAKPPSDVEAENGALASGMREHARALDRAFQAAASGDRETMARFADASTSSGVREMAQAAEKMKRKGYRLGPIARD